MSSFVCLISQQPNIWFSNCFFLLKIEIHTQILNTKRFLCNFWGLIYLQHKMGFLIRWFWSKLKLFDLELPHILKTIKIKTVIISIQSVLVTRPTRSHLGATWAPLGPVIGSWPKFCGFGVTLRQHKYEYICFRIAFFFGEYVSPWISQRNGFIFKIDVWISVFRRKNELKIRYLVVEIFSKQSGSFFLIHPVYIRTKFYFIYRKILLLKCKSE